MGFRSIRFTSIIEFIVCVYFVLEFVSRYTSFEFVWDATDKCTWILLYIFNWHNDYTIGDFIGQGNKDDESDDSDDEIQLNS